MRPLQRLKLLWLAGPSRLAAALEAPACAAADAAGPGGFQGCLEASSSSRTQSVTLRRWTHNSAGYRTHHDLGWLYSPRATEEQQQSYLRGDAATAAAASAGGEGGEAEGRAPAEQQVPAEELAAGPAQEEGPRAFGIEDLTAEAELAAAQAELAAAVEVEAGECSACGALLSEHDFYEAEFAEERQLVLRSTWLCAGAESLADMREKLEERIRFLSDLEADGWVLEAPLDDEYACLRNVAPKPPHERRLRDAWDIAEQWEEGIQWHHWPGPGRDPL
ncbi:hypothetical protein ABPG75_009571 [Micractinium tetrahymenae]